MDLHEIHILLDQLAGEAVAKDMGGYFLFPTEGFHGFCQPSVHVDRRQHPGFLGAEEEKRAGNWSFMLNIILQQRIEPIGDGNQPVLVSFPCDYVNDFAFQIHVIDGEIQAFRDPESRQEEDLDN